MTTTEELDMISRIRGEVMNRKDLTGENLFLAARFSTPTRKVCVSSSNSAFLSAM